VLDCFSLQAVPGIVGILLTALLCSKKYHADVIESRGHLFGIQLLGCVVTIALAASMTYLIILLADKLVGANIDVQTELEGLDMMEIGEVAYGIEKGNDDEDLGP
jgi:ammonia channel protein AmtB